MDKFNTFIEEIAEGTEDILINDALEGLETQPQSEPQTQPQEAKTEPKEASAEPSTEPSTPQPGRKGPSPLVNFDKLPCEWNKGVLFSGQESDESPFELANKEDYSKLIKIYGGSDLHCDGKSDSNKDDDSTANAFGVHFDFNLPVISGFTAGAKAGYSNSKSTATSKEHKTRKTTITISYAEINFKPNDIKPTEDFMEAIRKALQTPGYDKQKHEKLQEVFNRYGFFYPTTIKFGGKAISDAEDSSESNQEKKGNEKQGGVKFGFSSIGVNADANKKNDIEIIRKVEQNLHDLKTVGGDGTKVLFGVKAWIGTIESNQKVVSRSNMKPMYDLFDPEIKEQIVRIYEAVEHHGHIPYDAPLNMRHVEYGRFVYVDAERRIRDNEDDKANRSYRGKVLFAYEQPENYGNPPAVKIKPVPRSGEPRAYYARYGHTVTLEFEGKDGSECVQVTTSPLKGKGLVSGLVSKIRTKDPEKEHAKHPYVVASVYQSVETENALKKRWELLTAEGKDKDSYISANAGVIFKSTLINPTRGAGIYLGLAKYNMKSDKVISNKKEANGRYVAGKYCQSPYDESSQVTWEVVRPDEEP
ncbi:hypothetical protein EC973_009212 [Apophysomyces ossiformis]|uniref:MACPF-like domain-containing protein n=1 Tax=Apophysomyces ossiformis TaxID=679940 RepID=A0A8H7ENJ7_9FUNG|nr:hypothetical protein EC973_009212 [Apophysomyces ossiformis]